MARPADWQCPNADCVNHLKMVFGTKETCPKCGAAKDWNPEPEPLEDVFQREAGLLSLDEELETGGAAVPGRGVQGGERPEDWPCPNTNCLNHLKLVFGKKTACPKCGTARNAKNPGDWQCPNGACVNHKNTVFASKSVCPKCRAPRPGTTPRAPIPAMPIMQISTGGATGIGNWVMRPVATSMPLMRALPASSSSIDDWACPTASCVNNKRKVFAKNNFCPQCGSAKPVRKAPTRGQGGANPEDWTCPNSDCQNSRNFVFAKHEFCPKCGTAKPFSSRGRSRSPYLR